ncbi:MAG: ankyrin repeat domain-containing protein [Gammaproteobacteria bacterium]
MPLNSKIDIVSLADMGLRKEVENCLKSGINPNTTNEDGQTPLHKAVIRSDKKLISILIRYGANPKIADDYGRDCFEYAKQANNDEIERILKNATSRPSLNR